MDNVLVHGPKTVRPNLSAALRARREEYIKRGRHVYQVSSPLGVETCSSWDDACNRAVAHAWGNWGTEYLACEYALNPDGPFGRVCVRFQRFSVEVL